MIRAIIRFGCTDQCQMQQLNMLTIWLHPDDLYRGLECQLNKKIDDYLKKGGRVEKNPALTTGAGPQSICELSGNFPFHTVAERQPPARNLTATALSPIGSGAGVQSSSVAGRNSEMSTGRISAKAAAISKGRISETSKGRNGRSGAGGHVVGSRNWAKILSTLIGAGYTTRCFRDTGGRPPHRLQDMPRRGWSRRLLQPSAGAEPAKSGSDGKNYPAKVECKSRRPRWSAAASIPIVTARANPAAVGVVAAAAARVGSGAERSGADRSGANRCRTVAGAIAVTR